VAGAIQVPGDGRPIILLNETVTGGYRKIAVVAAADLPLLGQLAPGDTVRFQEMDIPAAVGLLRQVEAAVDWVRARWAD
jgi:antagonist of KipI